MDITQKMDIRRLFYEDPTREYHVREVARLLKISPTTTSKRLEELREEGIVKKEAKYNHLLFKSVKSKFFRERQEEYFIRRLQEKGLLQHLMEVYKAEAIILLPSRKMQLVVITTAKTQSKKKAYQLDIPVQVHVYTQKELEKKEKTFRNDLVNGITVAGRWEVFR